MRPILPRPACVVVALSLCAGHVSAQYDKDGRYVPSPMGVPSDPAQRVVPGYSGSPGETPKGTPAWPRDPSPSLAPMSPPRADPPIHYSRPVPLAPERCREPWAPSTGMSKGQFIRRCKALLGQ